MTLPRFILALVVTFAFAAWCGYRAGQQQCVPAYAAPIMPAVFVSSPSDPASGDDPRFY